MKPIILLCLKIYTKSQTVTHFWHFQKELRLQDCYSE